MLDRNEQISGFQVSNLVFRNVAAERIVMSKLTSSPIDLQTTNNVSDVSAVILASDEHF